MVCCSTPPASAGFAQARALRILHSLLRNVGPSGGSWCTTRTRPVRSTSGSPSARLEGFTRSPAKEMQHGATVSLGHLAPDAKPRPRASSPPCGSCSAKSAYVDGTGRCRPAPPTPPARRLGQAPGRQGRHRHRRGPRDRRHHRRGLRARRRLGGVRRRPAGADALAETAAKVGGTALALDVTADDAVDQITAHLANTMAATPTYWSTTPHHPGQAARQHGRRQGIR